MLNYWAEIHMIHSSAGFANEKIAVKYGSKFLNVAHPIAGVV